MIRQELSAPAAKDRKRKRAATLSDREDEFDLDELCGRRASRETSRVSSRSTGCWRPRTEARKKRYSETTPESRSRAGAWPTTGSAPGHLRTFRTAADREAGLLEAVVAPALRARNAERRQEGLRELEALAEAAQELAQLLFFAI